MANIVLTNYYDEAPLRILKELVPEGFHLYSLPYAEKKELLKICHKADYFLSSGRVPIDREVIEKASHLKMIQRTGVGLDSIDTIAIKEKNIPVYINRGVNARSVAEHTLMLMLATIKKMPLVHNKVISGTWERQQLGIQCNELYRKTVGLLGMGNIGRLVAELLKPFGVNILYHKPHRLSKEDENYLRATYVDFKTLYKQADILSLHCPLNKETERIIGKEILEEMKSTCIIINTARGKLIDQDALTKALKENKIQGAGLDVFEEEPISKNHTLLELKNVVLSPHIGGITHESFHNMMKGALENIEHFHKGERVLIQDKRLLC